jgi:hypothetical protein
MAAVNFVAVDSQSLTHSQTFQCLPASRRRRRRKRCAAAVSQSARACRAAGAKHAPSQYLFLRHSLDAAATIFPLLRHYTSCSLVTLQWYSTTTILLSKLKRTSKMSIRTTCSSSSSSSSSSNIRWKQYPLR